MTDSVGCLIKDGLARSVGMGIRLLVLISIGLLANVLMKYFTPGPIAPLVSVESAGSGDEHAPVEFLERPKPLHAYEELIKKRDIFQAPGDRVLTDGKELGKALPALHERIKLIGILMDNDSTAIVEDLKEKQTHFLSKGETIGMVLLEDIREDKAVFMYGNERVEMTP